MPEPLMLSTWAFGKKANGAGWAYLVSATGSSLDAVEQACRQVEADPRIMSVGYGGRPDQSGQATLDASIMISPARCGAVCCVRKFMHPVSIARLVMDRSPHVMLAGEGADRFAELHGMHPADLTTDESRTAWENWTKEHRPAQEEDRDRHRPAADGDGGGVLPAGEGFEDEGDHDTIGVLAQDAAGHIAGGCSTSGMAFKLPGRVGDSPIIGHGLYVDPDHGAAVATGVGELIMGVCGSFLAVELMRNGASPREATVEVLRRVLRSYQLRDEHQVAVIALSPSGRWSSAALRPGYQTAVRTPARDDLVEPDDVLLP